MTKALLEELEIKIAFLEAALEKLSDEYYQQQKQLDKLTHQLRLLGERMQRADPTISSDDRPPHY